MVDVAVESFEFRLVVVYAPNIAAERASFFRRLVPFPGRFEAASLNG